jgi:hypothetical protein
MASLENLIDIDSDSDIENPTEYNKMFDKLSLAYYPDPYNTFGQLIMSAIGGSSMIYLTKLKANKPTSYETDIEAYFTYCKNSPDDNYIIEITNQLKIDLSDTNQKHKLVLILDQLKIITVNIMTEFVRVNSDLFEFYRSKSDEDFKIDTFSADIIKVLLPMIKYSLLSDIKTK